MQTRHSIVALAAGAALALGTPVAQAHVSQGTRIAPESTTRSRSSSAAQLKAEQLRWKAIADFYLKHSQAQSSQGQRPNDRAASLGA